MSRRLPLPHRTRGFSLIELLTVIAVIGILAAILIPTVGGVRESARRSTAASNLRQIAIAYTNYAAGGGRPRSINADDIYDWASVLAEHSGFNDPELYILADDPLVEQSSRSLPHVIASPSAEQDGWEVDSDFRGFPLSFAVVNRLPSQAPASSTPVAWTRGLQTTGRWAAADSQNPGVYGDQGGHIVFLDGHVVFYRDLAEDGGQLIHYVTRRPTANIAEAIPPGAEAFDFSGPAF